MTLFSPVGAPEYEPSDEAIAQALLDVKREVRNRRIVLVAPVMLAAAALVAVMASPPRHGGITLVPDAEASDDATLPRVFGANGVWRLAEPIEAGAGLAPAPPIRVNLPSAPLAPSYFLDPPAEPDLGDGERLPASASTPPAPTLGLFDNEILSEVDSEIDMVRVGAKTGADADWSAFRAEIRLSASEPRNEDATVVAPGASEPAEATAVPDHSSTDEDVTDPEHGLEPTGDADGSATTQVVALSDADTGDHAEANPSTPQPDSADLATQPSSAVATIVATSVLVHRAHVSVTVQVVDDDSSVIDWCNTRVDWGDGSVTRLLEADGVAACAAPCEHAAAPSAEGTDESGVSRPDRGPRINEILTFTHDYTEVIDAAPRIFVATGDGCTYRLAELQLNTFTVVPY